MQMKYNYKKIWSDDMAYQIRTARREELLQIEAIYARARAFMASTGNPNQWGNKNPPTHQLVEDIEKGDLFVAEDADGIHGVFYFWIGPDPTYAVIEDGCWLSVEPYGTIHRIASDGSGGLFSAVLKFCRSRIGHIRIDTHHDNRVMQHVVEKHGFSRRGIIFLANGDPRIAYEMI